MLSAAQQKPLNLAEGLYLLRYESAEEKQHPPKISLSVTSDNTGEVEFVLPPGSSDPVLWSPGASLVLRVTSPSRLLVKVSAGTTGGSTSAKIQSIPLSIDPGGLSKSAAADVDTSNLRLVGHLAGQGDVRVVGGEWLGGPMAPSRIEGIAVEWPDKPRNFNLSYSVKIGGSVPTATGLSEAGGFAGTKGRALPLVGANFEISGRSAQAYQLMIESVFLGCPLMRASGQQVVLTGPTGREPLVGLNVRIIPTEVQQKASASVVAVERADPGNRKTGRVRVFRSKANTGRK